MIPLVLTYPCVGQNSADQHQALEITEVSFTIIGTSNVRDWEIESEEMSGTVIFGPAFYEDEEDSEQWFEEISLQIPNDSLDSGIGAMNSTMHDHLETEDHPEIKYRLESVEEVSGSVSSGNLRFLISGVGTAAGNEHRFTHKVRVNRREAGSYRVSGTMEFNITDFDIEPPTFMRGALVTEDEITVEYRLMLEEQE